MCWCGFGRRLWRFSGRGEGKRTAFPNALLIPDAVGAADPGLLHPDSQVFTDETDGLNDGEVGVPLAAPGASDFSDCPKGAGGHLVGQSEIIAPQRRRTGDNGDEHSRTDSGAAGAPETAGASGN